MMSDQLIQSLLWPLYITHHYHRYHVLLSDRPKLAHDLLEGLYSVSHAAQDIRLKLKTLGIHVPEMPQELPYNNRNSSFTNCLYTALTSLVTNCTFLTQSALDVSPRGAPSFERITLQPDGDSGMGFSFRETSSGLYIIKRIVPNTPAEKSGRIKSGDEVIEVNDQNVVGWKIKNVVDLIRSNPRCLVMVVRHYPATMELSKSSPNIQCNLIEKDYSKLRPASALEPMISQPSLVVSTPKKPPRPLDSVLRERCRSNSELDNHLKTVHTTKRMSQIYNGLPWEEGGLTYNGLSIEDLGFRKSDDHLRLHPVRRHSSSPLPEHNLNTKGWMDKMRLNKRSDTRSPNRNYHQRCNSSSPLPKSNNVTNAAWLESIKYRPSSGKTGSTKEGLVIDNINRSMPDLSITQQDTVKVKEKITPHSVKQEAQEMRSKTLPRRRKPSLEDFEELGEFQNYPVNKESNYAACVIGGVVHRIPLPTLHKNPPSVNSVCKNSCSDDSNDDQTSFKCYPSKTSRKRPNKRSSWSLNEKSLTLPKNTRFSMGELDEAGTLRKRKGKKPSRSTSSILGDLSVACKDLYPNACEGWLTKLGGSGLTPRNWRKRWFVLKGYCLYYFKTPQDTTALGVITLPSFNIAAASDIKKKYVFKAYHKNTRTYYFHAESESEMQRWMDKMLLASILYDESDKESGGIHRHTLWTEWHRTVPDIALHVSPVCRLISRQHHCCMNEC